MSVLAVVEATAVRGDRVTLIGWGELILRTIGEEKCVRDVRGSKREGLGIRDAPKHHAMAHQERGYWKGKVGRLREGRACVSY